MKMLTRLLIACLVLGVPASLRGQGAGRGEDRWDRAEGHQPGDGHAFQLLLQHRADLGLTEQQVARLEVIGRRLEAANRPLRERLSAERERFLAERRAELERMSPEQRRAEYERMRSRGRPPLPPAMRPVADEMRENIRHAMREAHGVLTPRQRMQVRRMMREAAAARRHGDRPRRGGWRARRDP
jgi:hypothetical protein